ncbi:hypothetical protein QQP08_005754 [Theobroma cacao]|nr:hypothetical protein QQP08_005754 [Theobroma cacao]
MSGRRRQEDRLQGHFGPISRGQIQPRRRVLATQTPQLAPRDEKKRILYFKGQDWEYLQPLRYKFLITFVTLANFHPRITVTVTKTYGMDPVAHYSHPSYSYSSTGITFGSCFVQVHQEKLGNGEQEGKKKKKPSLSCPGPRRKNQKIGEDTTPFAVTQHVPSNNIAGFSSFLVSPQLT